MTPTGTPQDRDEDYFNLLAQSIQVCADYRPKFGTSGRAGLTRSQFEARYSADPFYHWLGLDSPLIYAAQKAAGGMTSIYRQVGIGGERLFRRLLQDHLGLTEAQTTWSYVVPGQGGKDRRLTLDGRIDFSDLCAPETLARVKDWAKEVAAKLYLDPALAATLKGVVFEVRQGYKSADSGRQNKDIDNAGNAYAQLYVPSIVLLSTQINHAVAARYVNARWLLLTGTINGSSTDSTYAFCRDVLGYDLAAFFARNAERLRALLESVMASLLAPENA